MPLKLKVKVGPPHVSGPLALYPIWSLLPPALPYLPGPLAPAESVSISELEEGAQVDTLSVQNAALSPVLLLEGELVSGAQQDRTLNVSVLLDAGTKVTLPVSCVEAGRWGGGSHFTRTHRMASPSLRWSKTDGVNDSVKAHGGRASDQGQVWESVDSYVDRYAAAAPPPTSAFTDVEAAVRQTADSLVGDRRPEPGQTGVAAAIGGRLVAIDLFDRPETLEAYWDTVVAAYAVDAVDLIDIEGDQSTPVSAESITELLARIEALPVDEIEGVGLGQGIHLGDGELRASGLVWEDALVHLGVLVGAD